MSATGYTNGAARTTVDYAGGEMPEALRNAAPPPDDGLTSSTGLKLHINDDGSIEYELPSPAVKRDGSRDKFDANLAEELPSGVLSQIAMDYLDGVEADIASRAQFIANYNKGIDLLGLKIEEASGTRGSRQSISRVKNPALLKACVRSQSMARGQLLPAAGPAKIQTISGETDNEDKLARDFQQDFNYYLTEVDKPFYPDSDHMLFYRAFGGSAYKKVYRDPILGRAVSRFVSLESLIISEDATDLHSALRKTNELQYTPVDVKRMMVKGGWLDINLATPMGPNNPAVAKIKESQGLAQASTRTQDVSHTIYEGYWFMDPKDYGFDEPKAPEGLPLPYKVVIDRDSKNILALHRNWKPDDEEFKERQVFVKYGLIPGLGFLDYGFLHLIGNQTRILTAIWQILIDKGMLANFPGGIKARGARSSTNEMTPGVGEWVETDIGNSDDIRKVFMAMPYGDISPSFIQLMEIIQSDVEALAGAIDIKDMTSANTPVGSVLAMVEQQSQDLTAVQQRDHRAQKEELCLLRDIFAENPEDLKWLKRKGSERNWAELVDEFSDMDLVPASDPNIPSQTHRIMLSQFLASIAEKAPMLFGPKGLRKATKAVLTNVGINDAEDYLDTPENIAKAMAPPPPPQKPQNQSGQASLMKAQMELPLKQAEIQVEAQKVQQMQEINQRQAANEAADSDARDRKQVSDAALAAAKLKLAESEMMLEHSREMIELGQSSQPDPLTDAKLRQTNASTFAAMGSGAASFAKAGQTVQQGEQELSSLNDDLAGGSDMPRLQRPSRARKTPQTDEGQS